MRLINAGNVAGNSAFVCALGLMPLMVAAQTDVYPSKAVRVVIPFSPGTPIELPARAVTQRMMETFGQSFVFDYRTGASGIIGTHRHARHICLGMEEVRVDPAHCIAETGAADVGDQPGDELVHGRGVPERHALFEDETTNQLGIHDCEAECAGEAASMAHHERVGDTERLGDLGLPKLTATGQQAGQDAATKRLTDELMRGGGANLLAPQAGE